jgi:hypothetical protein
MIECSTQQVIQVVNPCNASTDWQNNPGSCRLRIKNYNAAAWAGACPACIVSGLPDWKGEFSVFYPGFAGTSEIYSPAAGLSIGGKAMCANPHVTSNFGVLGGFWVFQLCCDNGGGGLLVWGGQGPAAASAPLGIYNFVIGCLGFPTLEIEAFTP